MKLFRIIISLLYSLAPLLLFCLVALVVYYEFAYPFNLFSAVVLVIVGLFIARFLFNLMRRRGVLEVIGGSRATPKLDKLIPTNADGVYKLNAESLVQMYSKGTKLIRSRNITIWGDNKGRQLEEARNIYLIEYFPKEDVLKVFFVDTCVLEIKHPGVIFVSPTYVKVTTANLVRWQLNSSTESSKYYQYQVQNNDIRTESNTGWKPHRYDVGVGYDAVYIELLG